MIYRVKETPKDDPLCECGDPRSQHPNDGPCRMNGLGHGLPSGEPGNKCERFRTSAPTGNAEDSP
jgi:hypothetical protein